MNRLSKSILTFLTAALFTSGVVIQVSAQDSVSAADSLQQLPGLWKDIGAGADGSIWAAGVGLGIHQWTGKEWRKIDGHAIQVDVGPDGTPWVISPTKGIKSLLTDGSWQEYPGLWEDVGIGADGSVWAAGVGQGIHQWTEVAWHKVDGWAIRVDVAPDGTPWVISPRGKIRSLEADGSWQVYPGFWKDLAIGSDGSIWASGVGLGIHRWNGSEWVKQDGRAIRITAGPDGSPWIISPAGRVKNLTVPVNN